MKKTNSRWILCLRKLLLALPFLLLALSYSQASASEKSTRLSVFLTGGKSYPVGDFDWVAKTGSNWGAGLEIRLPSKWAIGMVFHQVEFEHQEIWYSTWSRTWKFTDWSFLRGNWYLKYLIRNRGISPFVKVGVGGYSMKSQNISLSGHQSAYGISSLSLVPGIGLDYSTKNATLFAEANYNLASRKSIGDDTGRIQVTQFFDVFLGVGFFIPKP